MGRSKYSDNDADDAPSSSGGRNRSECTEGLHVPGTSTAHYEDVPSPSKPTLGEWDQPAPRE